MRLLRQFCCWFWGQHDFHLKCDAGRIWQECFYCHWQRPGWTIDESRRVRLERSRRTAVQDRKILEMKRRRWRTLS